MKLSIGDLLVEKDINQHGIYLCRLVESNRVLMLINDGGYENGNKYYCYTPETIFKLAKFE